MVPGEVVVGVVVGPAGVVVAVLGVVVGVLAVAGVVVTAGVLGVVCAGVVGAEAVGVVGAGPAGVWWGAAIPVGPTLFGGGGGLAPAGGPSGWPAPAGGPSGWPALGKPADSNPTGVDLRVPGLGAIGAPVWLPKEVASGTW